MNGRPELSWEEQQELRRELEAYRAAHEAREREEAYAAVAKALQSYRWWGWTNIVNAVRICIQLWRQRNEPKQLKEPPANPFGFERPGPDVWM